MNYLHEQGCGEDIYQLRGRWTYQDHAHARSLIEEMQKSDKPRQVLDLGELEFIDSMGIGMLLIARAELINVDKEIVVRRPLGQVKRVSAVAQLAKLITIED